MKSLMHYMLLFITFWYLSQKHINAMTFLYPHTLQQLSTLEKIEIDMIMTTTITIMFTMMIFHMMHLMFYKTIKTLMITLMLWTIKSKFLLITFLYFLNTMMKNSNKMSNLTLKLSMKKFYLSLLLFLCFFLFLMKLIKNNLNRILYLPITFLMTMMMPNEILMTWTMNTMIMMIIEMYKIMTHTKNLNANPPKFA